VSEAPTLRFPAAELAAWCNGQWDPAPPDRISGISNDTRTIEEGDLYAALRGPRFDGHAYVDEAFEKGACAALVEAGVERRGTAAQPLLRVAGTGEALADLGRGYRRRVDPHVIGVTGSVAKTTVKEMIACILASVGSTACSRGNWNNDIGLPLSLLRMPEGTRFGVFELGSNHPGEIRALSRILEPDWGVVTLIAPAHLEFLESLAGVADEKADLLRALPAGGLAVLNRDTEYYEVLRDAAPCRTVTVSRTIPDADYRCAAYDPVQRSVSIRETGTGEGGEFSAPWLSRHDAFNLALSVAVSRALGVPWGGVREGITRFRGLPMRGQEEEVGGIRIVNDAYNANPTSMRAAIAAFSESEGSGQRWLALGDMLEMGEAAQAEHVALGRLIAGGPWAGTVLVGRYADDTARGAREAGFPADRLFVCRDVASAVATIEEHLRPGDAVLLKASRGVGLESIVKEMVARSDRAEEREE